PARAGPTRLDRYVNERRSTRVFLSDVELSVLAERRPALAHPMMAPLICWSFSNSMFRYLLVDHAVAAMWRSLAAARLSAGVGHSRRTAGPSTKELWNDNGMI